MLGNPCMPAKSPATSTSSHEGADAPSSPQQPAFPSARERDRTLRHQRARSPQQRPLSTAQEQQQRHASAADDILTGSGSHRDADSSHSQGTVSPQDQSSHMDGSRVAWTAPQSMLGDEQALPPLPPPPPPAELPCLVRWVKEAIFAPCFVDGEDFATFIRKAAVLTYSVMASAGWMLVIIFAVFATQDKVHGFTPLRINMIGIGLYMMLWYVMGNYVFIRRTQSCPLWLADLASLGAIIGMASFTVATLEADTRVLLMSTLLLTAMCSSPRFAALALGHAAVYVFHYLRVNFRREIPQLAFPWDDIPMTVAEKVIVFIVLSVVPSLGAVLGMFVIISNYIRRSQEGQAAFRMTLEVANQLQRYDCEGMLKTLRSYNDGVDAKLLLAFDAIRDNLKSYRPHIPQYLIQAAIERAEQHALELARAEASSETDDEGSLDLALRDSDAVSVSSRTSRSSRTSSRHQGSHRPSAVQSTRLAAKCPTPEVTTKSFTGPVTSLYVVLGLKDTLAAVRDVSGIVESLNHLGRLTNASIHHIDGDALFVTWNATTRVGNHEVRACNFAVRAMEALLGHANLSPMISIITCYATAMFAGTSHVHFTVLSDELRRHAQQLRFATEFGTIVCNGGVVQGAEMQFLFAGFDVDDRGRSFFELVKARTSGLQDEEWLYFANHSAEDVEYHKVSSALQLMIDGNNENARKVLESLSPEVAARPAVQHLIKKIG